MCIFMEGYCGSVNLCAAAGRLAQPPQILSQAIGHVDHCRSPLLREPPRFLESRFRFEVSAEDRSSEGARHIQPVPRLGARPQDRTSVRRQLPDQCDAHDPAAIPRPRLATNDHRAEAIGRRLQAAHKPVTVIRRRAGSRHRQADQSEAGGSRHSGDVAHRSGQSFVAGLLRCGMTRSARILELKVRPLRYRVDLEEPIAAAAPAYDSAIIARADPNVSVRSRAQFANPIDEFDLPA